MDGSQIQPSDNSHFAADVFGQTVADYRNRGHTREHASVLAAKLLGLSIHRAFRLLAYGGRGVRVLDAERDSLRSAFLAHCEEEAADLDARAAAARERMRRMLAGDP